MERKVNNRQLSWLLNSPNYFIESNGDSSHNRCMIFVDENARVYNNWNDYVKTNALPKSIIIAPKRGIYNGDYSNRVILDIFCSPKCGIGNTVIRSVDIGSTIAAIGSSGIMIASIMTTATIAAPVLVGAAAVGIGSAAYSTIRSTFNLVDRHQHEQTLSFGDVDARGNWLGVAGGAAGMASSAISPSISFLARNGRTIGVPLQATCNVINASAIAANGAGIVNGFFGIFLRIRDDDPISPLDAAQLAASLFLFTHSLNNFQSAKRIIKNSQDQEVTAIRRRLSFKESLTNNLRRYLRFDKMAKENVRLYGSEGDQHDIVRPLRNIPERIKIVSNAIKLKSALDDDAENIRFTLSMNGKAVLKNLTCSYIDKEEGILTLFDIDLGQFIRSIYNAFFVFNYDDLKTIIIDIIEFYTVQSVNLILDVDKIFSEKEGKSLVQSKLNTLLDFTKSFVEGEGESIQKKLNRIIPFETFLDDIFKVFQEMCTKSLADIPRETLIQKIHDFYENLRPQRQPDALCGECNGMYFIA